MGNSAAQNIYVYPEQDLTFGSFYLSGGTGGTVTVSNTGEWSSTGDVNIIGAGPRPAVYSIVTDSPIPITVEVETLSGTLSNSSGKEMNLEAGETNTELYLIQQGSPLQIFVGGRLEVDAKTASSPGDYNGQAWIRVSLYNG